MMFRATALAPIGAAIGFAVSASAACAQDAASTADPGEIIVTAQKRSQASTDVPIAITSISGDTLAQSGARSITDIVVATPGLYISSGGAYTQPVVRGIGTSVTSLGSDANVAIYVDGVYQPSQTANTFSLIDVQQVDVLKGPQGTLFGRNATGGAILVTTTKPSFDETTGKLSASYGRFNEVFLKGFVSTPLSDTAAFGISAMYRDDDGYVLDVPQNKKIADRHEVYIRPKFRAMLGDDTELLLTAAYSKVRDNSGYAFKIYNGNTVNKAAPNYPNPYKVALNGTPQAGARTWSANGTLTHDFGAAKLTSITSYASIKSIIANDLDGTNVNTQSTIFHMFQKTFTQEVNLASDTPGPLQYVVGLFYFKDKGNEPDLVINNVYQLRATIKAEAFAVFGEGEYEVTDGLFLIGGVRYSTEKRELYQVRANGTINAGSKRWDNWSPRLSVRYELAPRSNVYATYSQGFKSGTYNLIANTRLPVDPEKARAYEIGYKTASGPISFGTSAFYYRYKDLQVQALDATNNLTRLTNAGDAEIYGADADLTGRWGGLQLQAGLAYTHATFKSFTNAQINVPKPTGGNTAVSPANVTGNFLSRAPELTVNGSGTYTVAAAGGELSFTLAGRYSSKFYFDVANRLVQPAYAVLNGNISWTPANHGFRLSLWGNNLTDHKYARYIADNANGDRITYDKPITYGVSADVSF